MRTHLASQFERASLEVGLSRSFRNAATDFGGAGEGNLVNVHVLRQVLADGAAEAVHEVEAAFGEAGDGGDVFCDAEGGQRGVLGRFEHDGAPCGEGWSNFPGLTERDKERIRKPFEGEPDSWRKATVSVAGTLTSMRMG